MSATAQPALSSPKLILIVDDTPVNLGVISGALKDLYKTKVATNGERALALASADEKPDLILLDVMMPGMDGYEVCSRLKADPATGEIPVIFLTGQTSVEDETRGFEVGGVDYVHKPFSPAVVKARVRSHILLREARAQVLENGLILGMFEEATYEALELALEPGDRHILYTDGIVEAANPAKELYGTDRFMRFMESNKSLAADPFADALLAEITNWTGLSADQGQQDDITLLLFDFKRP